MHKYGRDVFGYLLIIFGSKYCEGKLNISISFMLYNTLGSKPIIKNC